MRNLRALPTTLWILLQDPSYLNSVHQIGIVFLQRVLDKLPMMAVGGAMRGSWGTDRGLMDVRGLARHDNAAMQDGAVPYPEHGADPICDPKCLARHPSCGDTLTLIAWHSITCSHLKNFWSESRLRWSLIYSQGGEWWDVAL